MRAAPALALALLLAACSGGGSSNTSSSQTPLVPPTTHRTEQFRPQISYDIGNDPWEVFGDSRGYFGIGLGTGVNGEYIVLAQISQVYDPGRIVPVKAPADLIRWVQANPYFRVLSKPAPSVVGNERSMAVDVIVRPVPREFQVCFAFSRCVPISPAGSYAFQVSSGDHVRFEQLEVGGTRVFMVVAAPAPRFRHFQPIATRLLGTFRFAR